MKSCLLFLLKLVLTIGCLYWAFSGVDFESTILRRPEQLDFSWVAAGIGFAGLTVLLTAYRWGIFLDAQGIRVSLGRLVELTLIGNMFALMSIGSLGSDAARILLLIKQEPRRKLAVTVSVMMDHVAGMLAMALMFFFLTAGRFAVLEQQSALGQGVLRFTWAYLCGGIVIIFVGFILMSPMVHGRVHRGGRWIRWDLMRTMPQAWDVHRKRWRHAVAGIAVSLVMSLFYYLTFWAGVRAVGCDLGLDTVLPAMPVVDTITSIPITVSGIGVREKLFEVLLGDLAGIPAAAAVSASLAGFLMHMCWSLVGAVMFLRHHEVSTREIRQSHG